MTGRIDSKVVLITGTSSGIGLHTAVELARRGERVFASMRDVSRAEDLWAAARDAGVELDVVALDVTSDDSVRDAFAHIEQSAGRVDVVVNNAAIFTCGPLEFTPISSVQSLFDTNVVGVIRVIRAAIPIMRRQGFGRIVNVGSIAAEPRLGFRVMSVYATTKAALHTLSVDLNKELAPLGIRVVLCEGGVGGRSAMFGALHDGVAAFGAADGAYAGAEANARAFADYMEANATVPLPAAAMIADACTTTDADLRHPLSAQADVDVAHQLPDTDYLRMCAFDGVPAAVEEYGPALAAWLLG